MTTLRRAIALLVALSGIASADVKPNKMFSSHMVLQRDMAVPVWGAAAPGEKVTVAFRDQKKETTADKDGAWTVKLDPLKVGEPGALTVTGKNTVTFEDVLVGEVWVGSGQSNMAGGAGGYAKRDEVLAKMIAGGPYPQLRLYQGAWNVADPKTSPRFSALCFSFGLPLQKALGVPVGLIVGAVGGTPSGRWLSPEMFAADAACQKAMGDDASREAQKKKYEEALAKWKVEMEKFKAVAAKAKAEGKKPPRGPRKPRGPATIGDLYARYMAPVVPYGIRGVLWDQGESGTAVPAVDQFTMMGALIKGWRTTWGQGEFPFLYVQKPSGGGCAWDPENNAATRMANKFTAQPTKPNNVNDGSYRDHHVGIMRHPNTAMVTAVDLGSGVHPVNKSGYGVRASRVAMGFVYGKKVAIYGPLYASHKVEGGKVRIAYSHIGQGLATKYGDGLQGFEVAGKDGKWAWAKAAIDGDTVVVNCDAVPAPTQVRYAWNTRNRAWANLFNKDGLPALTFKAGE